MTPKDTAPRPRTAQELRKAALNLEARRKQNPGGTQ